VPEEARYRGLKRDSPLPDDPDLTGFTLTGRGVVLPHDCDDGRLRPELVLGRIAEATPHLVGPFNLAAREATGLSLGGASVECRLRYLRWPRPGDRYDVRSAIVGIDRRTQRLAHYTIDGASGQVLASVEVVALMLDLDQRRAAAIPDHVLESMLRHITPIAALPSDRPGCR
jgi:acyl-CoA thioester hydrolase